MTVWYRVVNSIFIKTGGQKIKHTKADMYLNDMRNFSYYTAEYRGRDSSVGIATDYGLEGPDIEFRCGEIFRTGSDRPWGPPSLLRKGYRVFPRGKAARAWCWPPTPFLGPRSRKSRAILLLPLCAFRFVTGCLYLLLHRVHSHIRYKYQLVNVV
jgi:hypothetical protein